MLVAHLLDFADRASARVYLDARIPLVPSCWQSTMPQDSRGRVSVQGSLRILVLSMVASARRTEASVFVLDHCFVPG
jgi:hypothetical protein